MINFLTNAIKYSPEGGVIDVRVKKDKEIIRFSVTDHGRGIEEQYVAQLFDKYFQVPGTTEKSGTGLGLAISKEFIEAQGGKIWVESKYGEGSIFGFNILINA
jgi:signal transduction histidine kinase